MAIDLAARHALLELHARYAFTFDGGDAEGWAGCFTPDGVLRTTRPLVLCGREQLAAFVLEHVGGSGQSRRTTRHATWHETFEERADGGVDGRCSAAVFETSTAGALVTMTATYNDRFTRGPAGWLLQHRSVTIDR